MRATGIIKRIDDLGRVVIPRDIRRALSIEEGDPFQIFFEDDKVVFQKYVPVDEVESVITEAKICVRDCVHLPAEKASKILKKLVEIEKIMKEEK